jgi:NAD-dependent dihydropyrimidine dehydrogenase PreA subunit
MIKITVDEEACVGCGLCRETCPTEVLALNEAEGIIEVVKPRDCIQCLSCYYVCPATAIEYEGAELCPDFYRSVDDIRFIKGIL